MRILFFTIGNEAVASSRTRVYQHIPYLQQAGIKCRLISYISPWQSLRVINNEKERIFLRLSGKAYSFLKTAIFIALSPWYDILFIQKVLLPVKTLKFILLLNKNIIFDLDDAIFLSDTYNGRASSVKFLPRLEFIIRVSKYIVLENDFVGNYVRKFNTNIILITGPIDIDKYKPRERDCGNGQVVLGWIGSPASAFYLEALYGIFEMLAERHKNLTVNLVGPLAEPPLKGVNIAVKKWSLESEVSELQNFDIGLMPLSDDEWSKGKGGYKLLQYMATGICCVASPVGINKEIVRDGINGFLAKTPEEWLQKLSLLIENVSLRKRMGQEGRRLAQRLYSYQVNTPRLIEAFRKISAK